MKQGFWNGFVVYACIESLLQDLMGKAQYLRAAEVQWLDWKITVPIAIFGLVFSVIGGIKQ